MQNSSVIFLILCWSEKIDIGVNKIYYWKLISFVPFCFLTIASNTGSCNLYSLHYIWWRQTAWKPQPFRGEGPNIIWPKLMFHSAEKVKVLPFSMEIRIERVFDNLFTAMLLPNKVIKRKFFSLPYLAAFSFVLNHVHQWENVEFTSSPPSQIQEQGEKTVQWVPSVFLVFFKW